MTQVCAYVLSALSVTELALAFGILSQGLVLVEWLRFDSLLSLGLGGAIYCATRRECLASETAFEQETGSRVTFSTPVSWCNLMSWVQTARFDPGASRKAAAISAIFAVFILLSIMWTFVGMLVLLVTFVCNLAPVGWVPCMLFIASRLWATVALLFAIEQSESKATSVDHRKHLIPFASSVALSHSWKILDIDFLMFHTKNVILVLLGLLCLICFVNLLCASCAILLFEYGLLIIAILLEARRLSRRADSTFWSDTPDLEDQRTQNPGTSVTVSLELYAEQMRSSMTSSFTAKACRRYAQVFDPPPLEAKGKHSDGSECVKSPGRDTAEEAKTNDEDCDASDGPDSALCADAVVVWTATTELCADVVVWTSTTAKTEQAQTTSIAQQCQEDTSWVLLERAALHGEPAIF
jgi:hypothetical protein